MTIPEERLRAIEGDCPEDLVSREERRELVRGYRVLAWLRQHGRRASKSLRFAATLHRDADWDEMLRYNEANNWLGSILDHLAADETPPTLAASQETDVPRQVSGIQSTHAGASSEEGHGRIRRIQGAGEAGRILATEKAERTQPSEPEARGDSRKREATAGSAQAEAAEDRTGLDPMGEQRQMIGVCPECRGSGEIMTGHNSTDSMACRECGGSGRVEKEAPLAETKVCPECKGIGHHEHGIGSACAKCHGFGSAPSGAKEGG